MSTNNGPAFESGENGMTINGDLIEDERAKLDTQPPVPETAPVAPAPAAPAKKKSHVGLFIKIAIVLALFVGAGIFVLNNGFQIVADSISSIGYEMPKELRAIADDIKLTDEGWRILNATRPLLQDADEFNANCPNTKDGGINLGCYANKRIYVYNIVKEEVASTRQVTLAHELLHAVWERMSDAERRALETDLRTVYDTNEDVREHMEVYEAGDYNEMHSIVGTIVMPDKLPQGLRDHYAKYFQDQSVVVGFYDEYNKIFSDLKKRNEELKTQIATGRDTIKAKRDSYTARLGALNNDINDFNSQARNGVFSSNEELATRRADLVARQDQLKIDYDDLIEYTDKINALIDEFNNNAKTMNSLQRSMDSSNTIETLEKEDRASESNN